MNNDQEPRGGDAGEDQDRAGEAGGAEESARSGGGLASDAGWRQALSGLGVDVEHDRTWQAGEHSEERKPPREGRAEGLAEDKARERAGRDKPQRGAGASEGGSGMEEKAQWVSESEVSIERLYELFDSAYTECDLDEDGDLRVVTDSGPRIFLSLHEPNKLIRFMAFYKFREEAQEYDKLLFVNALNDDIVFIRFSLNGVDTLIADYYLPYARGASPFHIVNAAKLMGRVITSGIRQHDTNNLLE